MQAHLDPLSIRQLQLFLPPFFSFPRVFRHNLPRNQDWCRPQILLPPLFQEVFQNPFQSLLLLPSDIPKKQFSVQSVPLGQSTKTSQSTYLIFVIIFTLAKFLENKIHTEKTRKLRQNTQKIANFCVITAQYTVNCQFFALNL